MTTMNNEDPADPSVHEPLISLKDIRGAVARGWCHPANEHKEMDSTLALAIADEVHAALSAAQQPALYTADQMREAIAAERERSHELLQAADHIRAGLEALSAALLGAVDESERERDYLRWRMREIIPLFEEARDALCAISLVAATAYRVDLSLGSRMDAAGTRTREEFDAMLTAAEKEQPK